MRVNVDCIDGRTGAVAFAVDASEATKSLVFPDYDSGGRYEYEIMHRADGTAFIVLDDAHAEMLTGQDVKPPAKQ